MKSSKPKMQPIPLSYKPVLCSQASHISIDLKIKHKKSIYHCQFGVDNINCPLKMPFKSMHKISFDTEFVLDIAHHLHNWPVIFNNRMKALRYLHTIYDKVLYQAESETFIHSLKGLKNIQSLCFNSFCYSNPKIDQALEPKISSWINWIKCNNKIKKFGVTMGSQHSNQLPAFRKCIQEGYSKRTLERIDIEFKFFQPEFYQLICDIILLDRLKFKNLKHLTHRNTGLMVETLQQPFMDVVKKLSKTSDLQSVQITDLHSNDLYDILSRWNNIQEIHLVIYPEINYVKIFQGMTKSMQLLRRLSIGIVALNNKEAIKKDIFKEMGKLFASFQFLEELNIKVMNSRANDVLEYFAKYLVPLECVQTFSVTVLHCENPVIFNKLQKFIEKLRNVQQLKINCNLAHSQRQMAHLLNDIKRSHKLTKLEFVNSHSFATDDVGYALIGVLQNCKYLNTLILDLGTVAFSEKIFKKLGEEFEKVGNIKLLKLTMFCGIGTENLARGLAKGLNTHDVELSMAGNATAINQIIRAECHKTRQWKVRITMENLEGVKGYIKVGPTPTDMWMVILSIGVLLLTKVLYELWQ